ncbi:hypothetical protein KUTeg_002185 [Tegillarca granosa]|uniref:Uncharacterized protein n=1 Tax=Tegillarca granosa TaxID=220873 RepID=A0ABQ9FTL2_TEGGR|nr:hypothetical protein KUTeg_002185 [Tegillarca granosa]
MDTLTKMYNDTFGGWSASQAPRWLSPADCYAGLNMSDRQHRDDFSLWTGVQSSPATDMANQNATTAAFTVKPRFIATNCFIHWIQFGLVMYKSYIALGYDKHLQLYKLIKICKSRSKNNIHQLSENFFKY